MAQSKENINTLKIDILGEEKRMQIGGDVTLDKNELKVNKLLMDFKGEEIGAARQKGAVFPPAHHFFQVKHLIEESRVFKLIRTMPKGSVLHVHTMGMADIWWIIRYITNDDGCYIRTIPPNQIQLHYFKNPPQDQEVPWQSVKELRSKAEDPQTFDDWLYRQLTIIVEDPHKAYPTQDDVWHHFQSIFNGLSGIACYAPFFKDHLYASLTEFYQDNVQYIEMRGMIPQLYELDGSQHERDWTMDAYTEVLKRFAGEHADYCGTKLIFSAHRTMKKSDLLETVKYAIKMRENYPDVLLGFDLVGQEDQGHPLEYYMEELLYPSQLSPPFNLPYYFHAGETTWKDTPVDRNVIDALLLNTNRIGHGFALSKHPRALEIAKEKGVAIEVNPISNQVLQLVADLRDHPAVTLFTSGCPIVVSSDGPALWGASGLSYDYYEFFMAIAGADADLATLKKLFMDSIRYSGMTSAEKQQAMELWDKKWRQFISETIEKHDL